MAEKTIGIRIQLNGIDTVITDIKTLENELRKAKEDLKQVEIGGPIFNKLAKEISQAETKLQGLQDSARGISKEKSLEGFGKLGAGISSSFAAATAAVSLFGNKSESVQKAAIQAQNLLTIALSIRGIAEVKTGADIVARSIATKAATAADTAQIGVVKTLYTTLAANPYGAILAVVGLLVAAFLAFGNAEEEVAEKTKTLNELRLESEKSIITETNKLRTLQTILNDGNVSLEAKAGAYEELKKLVPTLTNLTLEQAQAQGILNSSIQDEITLIELRAKQKAYETYFVQQESKNIEKRNKERESYLKSLNVELNQERLRLLQAGVSRDDVEKVIQSTKNQKLAQRGFTDERETYRKVTEQIVALENKQTTVIKGQKVATEDVTKSEEKRKTERQAYIDLLLKEIKLNSELLVQSSSLRDLDNKILDETQKKVDQAQSYADTLNNLKTFTQLYQEATDKLLPSQDKLGGVFNQTKIFGEAFIDSLDNVSYTAYGAKKAIEDFDKQISELSKGLSKDDQVLLQDFANNYKEIFNTVQLLQQFKKTPLGFSVEDFQQVVTDLNLALGKITIDPYAETRSAEQLSEAKSTAKQRYEILKESFVKEYSLYLESKIDRTKLTNEEFENAKKKLPEIAASTFESFSGLGNELLKFEQGVTKTAEKIIELNNKLKELAPAARAGFITQNAEEISKQYDLLIPLVENEEKALADIQIEIAKKTFDEKKKYLEATLKLQADLLVQGIDIETLSYEQKLILLEKFLGKAVANTQATNNKLTEEQIYFLKITSRVVDEFGATISRISSLVAQSYSFQLQTLETKNKQALSSVVGDTEEANEKRIELESQYQKQRTAIEKEARIKSLQFQKVQAVTDVASASLKTFAELGFTPPAFVLVGIGAVLAAVQIGLIQQQINEAQSMAGGGRIRMGAGGMVMGPSHEQGGVSFASGGVNLEGGESVINRQSSMNYGGLLSSINQMGGGQPLVSNPSNSLSEERLVQAIAKSRQEPIRAYVMNSEITKGQAINKRLEELSTI